MDTSMGIYLGTTPHLSLFLSIFLTHSLSPLATSCYADLDYEEDRRMHRPSHTHGTISLIVDLKRISILQLKRQRVILSSSRLREAEDCVRGRTPDTVCIIVAT
jgi:hypothetical protein